jgi:hypothetical protein
MSQINEAPKTRRSGRGLIKKSIIFVFVAGAVTWIALQFFAGGNPSEAQAPKKGPLIVRGYIATMIGGNQGATPSAANFPGREVYIPGVTVFLSDAADPRGSAASKSTITDLSGRFTVLAPKAGRYRVCWKTEGFVNECAKDILSVNAPIFVSTVRIMPDRTDDKFRSVIFGKVNLKDGSRARRLEPLQGVNAFAKVSLFDRGGKKLREVFVNNFDEYVIARAPSKQEINLRAEIEGGSKEQRKLPQANLGQALFDPINLVIENTPPRMEPLVATDLGGVRVKVARPGDRVVLKSRTSDKDGDGLVYRWRADDGSGALSTPDKPDTEWTLPKVPGNYSVKLLVWDKKGGYAKSELELEAGDGSIGFSGKVDGTDVPAIGGAEVEVNGKTTRTNPQGWFSLSVDDAKRFVLNIRKPGYGLVSRIYDDAVAGGQWTMTKASVTRINNPKIKMTAGDKRDQRNCPGPQGNRLDWRRFERLLQPQWQDGKGNVIFPPKRGVIDKLLPRPKTANDYPCGAGAKVSIPGGALQDANGVGAAGPLDISIATIDLRSPEQMPGDYSLDPSGSSARSMESYGAVSIDITSVGGQKLNLISGSTADISIPVDPGQLAAGGPIPPSIPLLSYDETKGVWVQDGTATLSGNAYVAQVKHFSSFNMDLIKTNQSCVRILSPTLPGTYDLEVTIPSPSGGGAAPIVRQVVVNNGVVHEHVLYNLPNSTNIVLVPIRQSNNTPIGVFVVNTSFAQSPQTPNLPIGPPYTACSTTVTLTELAVPPPTEEFLQGLYTFEATNLSELTPGDPGDDAIAAALALSTQNYYDQIDPRNKRETLAEFKTVNGFDILPDIRASFANGGDLGFGRDMHCKQQLSPSGDGKQDFACYVTNYGRIDTPDQDDANGAFDATDPPVATVAMEFSAVESPLANPTEFDDLERVVKFYVYNSAGNALLNSADLDLHGARPIPQLCMVCHNGTYPSGPTTGAPTFNTRDDTKLGSRFLPFDLHYYVFPASEPGIPRDNKAAQQNDIHDLNTLVRLTQTQEPGSISATPVITEAIDGMYTPPPALPTQDEDFSITGWNSQPIQTGQYKEVVSRTCRTCHVANIFGTNAPGSLPLTFDQGSQLINVLGKAQARICTEHTMPHAQVTNDIFWTSSNPSMPAQFIVFGNTLGAGHGWNNALPCQSFTPPGGVPVAFYTSDIQPIWDGSGTGTTACTACHGPGGPAGLDLSAGSSYTNIFNVTATQSALKRIAAGGGAGAANQSYIYHKIEGTQANPPANGSGVRMPQGGAQMNQASRDKVRDWINSGAPGP